MASRLVVRCRQQSLAPLRFIGTLQWQLNTKRRLASTRKPDATILPGSMSQQASDDIPPPPRLPVTPLTPASDTGSSVIPPTEVPLTPPEPEKLRTQSSAKPTPSASTDLPRSPPSPPVQPKPLLADPPKRTGRFRRLLTSMILLSVLGYAGGVYFSLENDNFHDFFTEYIPFGEDAVAYFEERDFRNRFPSRTLTPKTRPQIRGENKVTIAKSSGVTANVVENNGTTDPAQNGTHVSAVGDNVSSTAKVQLQSSNEFSREKTEVLESAKSEARETKPSTTHPSPETRTSPTDSTPSVALIDHISVSDATEPIVQNAVKLVNDIINVVNSDPNASKYQSTLTQAKSQLSVVIAEIGDLKARILSKADQRISDAHSEFDAAARELVSRLEREMQSQELHWREEYETERERLAKSYEAKLAAQLDAARKVAEQRTDTAMVEQEIALHRQFAKTVRDRIESERNGRLSRLDELSTSVTELQKLSGQWNQVVDTILSTQHLHVALDAIRAALNRYDHPKSFVNELVALKEASKGNELVSAALASIPPIAYQQGIPSHGNLIDRYKRVAAEVRKAALLPEDAGLASHAASAVMSRLMFSKKLESSGVRVPEGDDVEAVLMRTEVFLEQGDLDGAVREMNGLRGWAGLLSRDWIADCRRVLETRQAIDVMDAEARLQSVLVE